MLNLNMFFQLSFVAVCTSKDQLFSKGNSGVYQETNEISALAYKMDKIKKNLGTLLY